MNSTVPPTSIALLLACFVGWASSACDTRAGFKSSRPPTPEAGPRDDGGARKEVADASRPAAPEAGFGVGTDCEADAAAQRSRVAQRFSNGAPSEWMVDEFGIGQRKEDSAERLRRVLGGHDAHDQCFSATTGKTRACSNALR